MPNLIDHVSNLDINYILLKSLSKFSVLNCGKIHNFQPNSCEMGISALKQFGKRPRGQRTLVTDLAGVHAKIRHTGALS